MNFGQAFLVDSSLSPAHIYGDICIIIVIEQPMCQICRKGQQVVQGLENKIQLKRLLFPTFVRIVFSLVCSTSSYPIELVTELSCLLFDISDFCLPHSFTTAHFLHVSFLHCRCRLVTRPSLPRIVEPLFSLYVLVLEIIFGLFLCLAYIPYLSWLLYLHHLSSHLQGDHPNANIGANEHNVS